MGYVCRFRFNSPFFSAVSPCDDDPQPGLDSRCRASKPRVYYNKADNKCVPFTYGGCGATSNIFETVEDCEKTCLKQ